MAQSAKLSLVVVSLAVATVLLVSFSGIDSAERSTIVGLTDTGVTLVRQRSEQAGNAPLQSHSSVTGVELFTVPDVDDIAQRIVSYGIMALTLIAVAAVAAVLTGILFLRQVSAISAGIDRLAVDHHVDAGIDLVGRGELSKLAQKLNQLLRQVNSDRAQWEDERRRLIDVFRTLADAVLLLDESGTIRFCNEEALTRLGLPGGGLAQRKAFSALLPTDHPLVGIVQTAKASATALRDVAAEFGNGKDKLSCLVSVFPLSDDPTNSGQLVIVRDLKSVQQFEGVVDYSSRLARLGGLISGVAHQIRNPLNAMTLELELLSQDARDGKPVDDRVQMVRDDMLQLAKAIDALTRFMRPENLKPEFVAANELVTEAAKVVADPLIEVVYRLDPSNPKMRVDRAVLIEAFRNVIQNAVEAMPNGGKLEVTTRQNDGFVDILLSDTGSGIPPDILDRVPHLYFTTKEYGTGLGLPMALRAVDLHGGFLSVDSKVDAGTEVKIRLPAQNVS